MQYPLVATDLSQHDASVERGDLTFDNDQLFFSLVEFLTRLGHISGFSAAGVVDDEMVWSQGFGLSDREKQKQTTPETIFLVASISKTFTATAVMQLVEQGCIDLDADVNTYLNFSVRNPSFPEEPVTVRMLLGHQSSIATDLDTSWTRMIPGDLTIGGYPYPYLRDYFMPGGLHYKPQFWMDYAPGDDMVYANSGFALLGYLVERISGESCAAYCTEYIFEPLGMYNTSFRLDDLDETKLAVPYEYDRGYSPYPHYQILDYPAGGLRTTVVDLSRFLLAQMNNGTYDGVTILSADSVELMQSISYPSDTYDFQYGLGFQIWITRSGTVVGHTGGLYGVATKMLYRPDEDMGIIMFSNNAVSTQRGRLVFALIERLLWMKTDNDSSSLFVSSSLWDCVQSNRFLSEDFCFLS